MSIVIDEVQCMACLQMIPVSDFIGLCECGMQYELDWKWTDTLPEDER